MINIQLTGTMSVMLQPLTLLPLSVLSRRRFLATAVLASTGLVLTGGTYDRIPHVSHATLPGRLRGLPRLGTVVECQVFHPSHRHAEQALSAAFAAVDQVDHDMSLYRSQSDIGCINRYGVQQALPIQASTFSVIQDALRIAHMSKGALDITITPLLTQWGFFSQHHQAPSPQHLKQALSLVNYQEVHLDTTRRTVRLGQLGMQLDLGSLGKGYAVDHAIDTLQQQDVRHGMVNAGGDLRLLGTHPDGHPWVVGVQHPLLPAQVLLALSLDAGSVATSGNYVRYRVYDGRKYGHLLHPQHGYPAATALSATVVTTMAMQADALATAAMVLGPHDGMQWLASLPGVEGLMVTRVVEYYRGSEKRFLRPRSYQGLLEVSHFHLFAMGILILTLTHLVLFVPLTVRVKFWLLLVSFGAAVADEAGGWLVRYVHPTFAYWKIAAFITFQLSLAVLIITVLIATFGRTRNAYTDDVS